MRSCMFQRISQTDQVTLELLRPARQGEERLIAIKVSVESENGQ